ncbi:MAG: DUF507 family protein [Dissulfurispiraceae bacterium]
MMLSDDKVMQMTYTLLKGLLEKNVLRLKEDDGVVRKEIRRIITNELKVGEDIDVSVRKKLQSYSRKLIEGSPEWDVLHRKFFEEEELRRGRK